MWNSTIQNWVFGLRAAVSFGQNVSPVGGTSQIATGEGCASISDTSGNLVLYTDGVEVWDGAGKSQLTGLRGNRSSTQAAIVIPRPQHPGHYWIFTTDGGSHNGPYNHFDGRLVTADNSGIAETDTIDSFINPNINTGFTPTERLIAVPHVNCRDYWIITIVREGDITEAADVQRRTASGFFRVFAATATGVAHIGDTAIGDIDLLGYLKANAQGDRLAFADSNNNRVLVYHFDNSSGTVDAASGAEAVLGYLTYGLEFARSGDRLFVGELDDSQGRISLIDLTANPLSSVVVESVAVGGTHPGPPILGRHNWAIGSLQIGPDDRIYVARFGEPWLGVVDDPATASSANSTYVHDGIHLGSAVCTLGLPTFAVSTCPTDSPCQCQERVRQVDEVLGYATANQVNAMATCGASGGGEFPSSECGAPAALPELAPTAHVTFGAAPCDCIESDDLEVMNLTICNPYPNLTLRNVTVPWIGVLNPDGTPVATLPNGASSVDVTPRGPLCFGDIEPCACVSREFVLRNRGARATSYHLDIPDICFQAEFCGHTEACFEFTICPDEYVPPMIDPGSGTSGPGPSF